MSPTISPKLCTIHNDQVFIAEVISNKSDLAFVKETHILDGSSSIVRQLLLSLHDEH